MEGQEEKGGAQEGGKDWQDEEAAEDERGNENSVMRTVSRCGRGLS